MPRYFFDFVDGKALLDEDGLEFENSNRAIADGLKALGAIATDEALQREDPFTVLMVIRQRGGEVVYSASMSFTGSRMPPRAPATSPDKCVARTWR